MDGDNEWLERLFLALPALVLGLFAWNHHDWLLQRVEVVLPVALLIGFVFATRVVPGLWQSVKGFAPIAIFALAVAGAILYAIFGGGADAFNEFGAHAREREIMEMK